MTGEDLAATLSAEVALLRRQLDRERRARLEAEQIGEAATTELWQTVQRLEEADRALRSRAAQSQMSYEMARTLRLDLEPQHTMGRAVAALGAALGVDRCLIRLADDEAGIGTVTEQWVRPGVEPLSTDVELDGTFARLANTHAGTGEALWIDDLATDPRLRDGAAAVREQLGCDAYGGVPMLTGPRLVGWLALHHTTGPHEWTDLERAVSEGLAYDLGGAIMQAMAHEQQLETVARLREVDRVKTEFVSRVSHELRTPLTSLRGYVEMLGDESFGTVTGAQNQALSVMGRNCDRLLALIENLLMLSKADAQVEVDTDVVVIDLQELFGEVRRALVPMLTSRAVHVSFSDVPHVADLHGRPHDLDRVLLNLMTNAVKFTPDGGEVRVEVTHPPDEVRIRIEDTGVGIAARDLPHMFRRFFRAQSAIDAEIQGTGLGLALVRSIVDAHGGTISLTSTLGVGTCVEVELPTGVRPPQSDLVAHLTA